MPNYSIAQLHYTNSYSIKKNQTKLLISHKNLHNGAFARTTDLICNLILQFFVCSFQCKFGMKKHFYLNGKIQ